MLISSLMLSLTSLFYSVFFKETCNENYGVELLQTIGCLFVASPNSKLNIPRCWWMFSVKCKRFLLFFEPGISGTKRKKGFDTSSRHRTQGSV